MDDNQFDKIFRDKLDELDPAYSSSAWDNFIARYATLLPAVSIWNWKNMAMAGGLLLITLLNAFWAFNNLQTTQQAEKQFNSSIQLGLQEPDIITDTILITDTVFIEKIIERSVPGNTKFADSYNSGYQAAYPSNTLQGYSEPYKYKFVSRYTSDKLLRDRSLKFNTLQKITPFGSSLNRPEFRQLIQYRGNTIVRQKAGKPWMFHLGAGYGVKIPYTDPGASYLDNSYSFSIEVFRSPHHRLQTGISFFPVRYLLDDTSDPDKFGIQDLAGYPNLSSLPHLPNQINVRNQIIQVPLYYRHYEYLTNSWAIFMGAGVTLDLLTEQRFNYTLLDIENKEVKETTFTEKTNQQRLYLGTVGGLFGLSYEIADDWSISSELNYQYGLSDVGLESRSFNYLNFNFMLNYHLD